MPRATRRRVSSPVTVPDELEVSEQEEEQDEDNEGQEEDGDEEMQNNDEEEDEAHQPFDGIARLRFNQTLNWRAGRPIAVADLLRRLDSLARELQSYEQDEVEVDSLQTTAKELANVQLLAHKDKGVKALAASCVVDIFRLCAPNAPYTPQQMRDIFTLIVKEIFPAIADPSHAYNRQHLYVLKSLAEVKSIILLTDTSAASTLIEILFKECFDVLGGPSKSNSNEELSKNVEHHMTSILTTLVDESDVLPNEVTYTILAQFLRTNPKIASSAAGRGKKSMLDESQGTLLLKDAPPAYNMAKNICNASPEKMSRNVTRYWSGVVTDASLNLQNSSRLSLKKGKRRVSDDEDDSDVEAAREASTDMEEIKKAHDLLRELWRATPNILNDIVPLLENELSEENVQKRQLAVETVGDMIAGIGHAGPPMAATLNPAAYPSQSLIDPSEKNKVYDFLTTPTSPIAFIARYHAIYQAFLSRRHDKSSVVRAAWATAVGRILLTSAGGVGLSTEDERNLADSFAECLMDMDEKVRHNAVKIIEHFDYDDILTKLGNSGGVDEPGSILANLAERVKDKKKDVRNDALRLLGRIWGVAVGAIGEGSERTEAMFNSIPSKILGTYYINDLEISTVVDRILFESLLPLSYPPVKNKPATNGESQRSQRRSQGGDILEPNPDKLRTARILLLVRSLDDRAKVVFFAMAKKQIMLAKYMTMFLDTCEKYNGGVSDDEEGGKRARDDVQKMIEGHTRFLPDGQRTTDDMWKFAKVHDRRAYALIRFCLAPESDYKKVRNAYSELTKKLNEMTGTSPTFEDTITTLVLRASVLVYNRSHVQAIIEFSRSDEGGLGQVAHEILEKISKDKPDVFKAHVQDLCRSLEAEAPTAKRANETGAVQDLKACAQFARQFPKDVPKDRKFIQALFGFIGHGTPAEAAKYGASIILTVAADKQELYAKDIFKQCTEGFKYGQGNFLNRLAALSQLMLFASGKLESEDVDAVVSIAINDVLANKQATPAPAEGEANPDWTDIPDANCAAKMWALKILVNHLREFPDNSELDDAAKPVFQFVNKLIQEKGQTARDSAALAAHQSRMRLAAARSMLKMCCEKQLSARLTPSAFNSLAMMAMDSRPQVRMGFVSKIMKYLGQNKLSSKFYTPLFLLGHEPDRNIKSSVTTWLKARTLVLSSGGKAGRDTSMEATFARLLSLLAHHPDWPPPPIGVDDLLEVLKEMTVYIVFYLQTVGTNENLGLVYHIAQRVKGHQDGIVDTKNHEMLTSVNERLFTLSDLSQGVIRLFLDNMGWNLQAWPGKVKLPQGIFRVMGDADTAREVAMKNYLPVEFEEGLDDEVRGLLRSKKRKPATTGTSDARKRAKVETGERKIKQARSTKKTPKKSRANGLLSSEANAPSSEIRRSGRGHANKNYVEVSSDEESANGNGGEEDEELLDAPKEPAGSSVADTDVNSESEVEQAHEEADEDQESEVLPRRPIHSSPIRKRSAAKPTSSKAVTPKRNSVATAKQGNDSAVKSSPRSKRTPHGIVAAQGQHEKPKAKTNAKSKENVKPVPAIASRSLRASRRGKPAVDEYDMPDSD